MADELRSRFQFCNPCVQTQTAWKLYAGIVQKKPCGLKLNEKSKESLELKVLWEMCTDSCLASLSCSQCLVQLVAEGHAELDFILKCLLNVVPSAKNLNGVVQAVSSLLLLQVRDSETQGKGSYCCPYSLRTTPHPFISVLTSRPDAAHILVEQIGLLLDVSIDRFQTAANAFKMLEPFLKFVFLDPRSKVDHLLRQLLQAKLLQIASDSLAENQGINSESKIAGDIINFLFSLLPYFQVDCVTSLSHTTVLVHHLCQWMIDKHKQFYKPGDATLSHAQVLVHHLLVICREKMTLGQDMMSSLVLLQKLQKKIPEAFQSPSMMATLGVLLLNSPDLYSGHLLQLCLSVVQRQASSSSKQQTFHAPFQLLLLPVLQILASPPPRNFVFISQSSSVVMKCAAVLLGVLEAHALTEAHVTQQPYDEGRITPEKSSATGSWQRRMEICVQMMLRFSRDDVAAQNWLHFLQTSLPSYKQVPGYVSMMLSALLMTSNQVVALETLKIIPLVAKADPSQAPRFLPLILYKLGKETDARFRLELLYTIPELATHKLCVAPVLRTLHTIGMSPSLKPLSIRLLCKLWLRQSRVFPHFHRALLAAEDNLPHDLRSELNVAVAASIRDICRTRATQHGADMLSLISKLLNENLRPGALKNDITALVVSFAVQGLHALCQEEVVDVCTAWEVLSSKLNQDRRPQVLVALSELFGSVPDLTTNTAEYEDFKGDVVNMLWSLTQHEESHVACAAFSSLAFFDPTDFKLIHLPPKIYAPLKARMLSSRKREDVEEDEDIEKSMDHVTPPGHAYVELLQTLSRDVLSDFQKLLASIVRHEVSTLPRGQAFAASRGSISRDKAMLGIPEFLLSQFEKSKSPGLNQGLAAGLLFSYEPQFEVQQGKRARMYVVNCARSYRQWLDILIHEVPVQPSEWHRNLLTPEAWTAFMRKAFHACVQGRDTELEMQVSRGHLKDPEELAAKKRDSWLWVRDQLTEQLKRASRGNPSVQGNSVLALAALANSVAAHVTRQTNDESHDVTEHQHRSFTEWFGAVVETLMVVLDGNYKPQGSTLSWCQQVSSPSSTASSVLSRACAALALSQLVPVLVTVDPDKIEAMTELLKQRVPGQSKAGCSAVIQIHCALGLGMLLSKLYEEHFSDLAGTQGYLLMSAALDVLENTALSADLENTEGACLGMGLALSSLCKEGIVDSRVHVTSMHQKLMGLLGDTRKEPDQKFQSLTFSFACLSVSAFHTGLMSPEVASQCAVKLQELIHKHQQAQGISMALGLLLHGLGVSDHTQITGLASEQAAVWQGWLEDKSAPTLQRLAGLHGIMGLLGSEQGLFQVDSPLEVHFFAKGTKSNVIKTLQKFVTSRDVGLGSHSAWLLGHLCTAETSGSYSRTSVPSSYSYLQESSTLRALFDFLISAGKTGPHLSFSSAAVDAALTSLVAGPQDSPPPVNWASLLGPLMRAGFGEETCRLCLKFAVTHAQSSSSVCSFISSWLGPALFQGLETSCKRELLEYIWKLVFAVPPVKIKEFFEGPLALSLDSDQEGPLFGAAIRGLLLVLELNEPPASVFSWAYNAVEHAYSVCRPEQLSANVQSLFCRCLAQLPETKLEKLSQIQTSRQKAVIVRCFLAREGHVTLKWLSPCVDWVLQSDQADEACRAELLLHVVHALAGPAVRRQNANDRLHWFMELSGQIKNAVRDASCDTALETGLTLLSAATSAWCKAPVSLELGLTGQLLPKESGTSSAAKLWEAGEHAEVLLLPRLLPVTLPLLLEEEPWTLVTAKTLEWLFSIQKFPVIQRNRHLHEILQDTVLALKHTDAYKQMAVWTEAVLSHQAIADAALDDQR